MKNFPSAFSEILSENGILRIYNQFPRFYISIKQMTIQLEAIAQMGFNAIWVNPLQECGTKEVKRYRSAAPEEKRKKPHHYLCSGSLYAMANHESFNPQFFPPDTTHEEKEQLLREYTQTARSYGLIPIFDLVLNHIAVDEGSKTRTFFEKISQDFLGGANVFGDGTWDDVIDINYYGKGTLLIIKPHVNIQEIQLHQNNNVSYILVSDNALQVDSISAFYYSNKKQSEIKSLDMVLNEIKQNKDQGIAFQKTLNNIQKGKEINWEEDAIELGLSYSELKKMISTSAYPYENEDNILINNTIIDEFWMPFIRRYILDYGFMGIRVDAALNIPVSI